LIDFSDEFILIINIQRAQNKINLRYDKSLETIGFDIRNPFPYGSGFRKCKVWKTYRTTSPSAHTTKEL
jgi:hypothetical protein